jgi:hypothetical protein
MRPASQEISVRALNLRSGDGEWILLLATGLGDHAEIQMSKGWEWVRVLIAAAL